MSKKISNHVVQQTNINFVTNSSFSVFDLPTGSLKTAIMEIFGVDTEPAITQLQDLMVIAHPTSGLNINFLPQSNRIMVADTTVTDYVGRNSEDLIRFLNKFVGLIFNRDTGIELKAFGQNIISSFDVLENAQEQKEEIDSGKLLQDILLQDDLTGLGEMVGAGVSLIYKDANYRYQLKLDPRFSSVNVPTRSVRVNYNVHRDSNAFYALDELTNFWNNSYAKLSTDLVLLVNRAE